MGGWIFFAYIIGLFTLLGLAHWRRSRRFRDIDPQTGRVIKKPGLPPLEPWLKRAFVICYSIYALLLPIMVVTGLLWMLAIPALLPLTPIAERWHNFASFVTMFIVWLMLVVIMGGGEIYMRLGFERRLGFRRLGHIAAALGSCLGLSLLILLVTRQTAG